MRFLKSEGITVPVGKNMEWGGRAQLIWTSVRLLAHRWLLKLDVLRVEDYVPRLIRVKELIRLWTALLQRVLLQKETL